MSDNTPGEGGPLKYFEIPLYQAKDWTFRDWVAFVLESSYTSIFPFLSGVALASTRDIVWLAGLALPLYFRFRVQKRHEQRKTRIFFKD